MKDNIRALYLIDCLTAKAGDRTYPYGKYTYYASPYPIHPTIGEHDYRASCMVHLCQETNCYSIMASIFFLILVLVVVSQEP